MLRARLLALVSLTPLVLVAVSLMLSLVAAADPCPTPDAGGC